MRVLFATIFCAASLAAFGQGMQPQVAIHDSELTRALESIPASSPTPTGPGTTGFEWWPTNWHYFVMPESLKEALRSDGTAFTVVGDSNITAGVLLTNGLPKYPILISLASEAMRNDEIAPLTNYVAAGGFLFVGSSSFTRNTNGTTRGDFAFANELGVRMLTPTLTNGVKNLTFTKQSDHRLVSHIPGGQLTWRMPAGAEEINWGISPDHPFSAPHDVWRVANSNATLLATADLATFLTVKAYGKGYFIYYAETQPLIGHGSFAPSMYSYLIFRRAIEWAFEAANLPIPKLSPWPYPYDAAFMVRHDLENFTNEVSNIELSAAFEYTNGAKGDYYFCTGTLRDDASPTYNTNTIIASLRKAVTNYGATIGPHNGGLKNPSNTNLVRGTYDYWHWGPDEALDFTPSGYANGKAYAMASLSNSFLDIESWLSGITNGLRTWVACNFNATRDDSYDIQAQLKVNITGDQKISVFPHWTLSTRTAGKRYAMLSEPVNDWFVNGMIAQSLEDWHPPGVYNTQVMHDAIDFYYNLGGLINIYSHTMSTGLGNAGQLVPDYITYSLNTNLHPRVWSANGIDVYQWWLQRSNAQITVSCSTNGTQLIEAISIAGATHTNTTVEFAVPATGSAFGLEVYTNGVLADASVYRINGQIIKVRVGTSVSQAQVRYTFGPKAQDDNFTTRASSALTVAAPGVLANDGMGSSTNLSAVVVNGPANGVLTLATNGGFTYTPTPGFFGTDSFSYQARDSLGNASGATVTITVNATDILFSDDFTRGADPGPLAPWVVQYGVWSVTGGTLKGGTNYLQTYGMICTTNSWTNYSVQARVRFPAGALGGGLGGRVNPATGKHYAAWIYPENSPAGSNVLKLIKFRTWTTFGFNGSDSVPMQQVSLASVGTNFHTVKLAFQTNRIAVYFDGVQRMSVADTEPQPYLSGAVSADMSTYMTPYNMTVDDVIVSPLVAEDSFSVNEDTPLVVTAPGVLTNDTPVFGTNLTVSLVTGPTNGGLTLNSNGSFSYLPATNYYGRDSFTYQANDGPTNLGVSTVNITVNSVNDPPLLPPQPNRTLAELMALSVTNTALDVDLPPQVLTYTLINPPDGASIDLNGIIQWTPAQGTAPSTNLFTTVVIDDAGGSATNAFFVVVIPANMPPILPSSPDRTIDEMTLLVVTNTATDALTPPNGFTYTLANPPFGALIDSNGIITWTPSEAQGPGSYTITTIVSDNGLPPLMATNSFGVVVNELNLPPILPTQNDRTINELTTLSVTNSAFDPDLPANILSYTLLAAPTNAVIDANGIISWQPTEAQGPSTNAFTTAVTDSGGLSTTNTFTVVVNEVNVAPVLPVQTNRTIAPLTALVVNNTATDADLPANNLTYSLVAGPASAAIDTNGVITWTPPQAQPNSTNLFTTVVTDSNRWALSAQQLSATNSFSVIVLKPVIVLDSNALVFEGCLPTNNAIDPGESVTLLFSFKNAGAGNTANLVATLLETNGVVSPSGPQNYGVLTAGGSAVSLPFTFLALGACGGTLTATVQLQDGPLSLGTFAVPFTMGSTGASFAQNFDGVTAPALPTGWSTAASGFHSNWVTVTAVRDTLPNSAHAIDASNVGVSDLVTPSFTLPFGPAQLSFRNNYSFEADSGRPTNAYDGGVLEIKIGTNAFIDITNAPGASWVSNGYNRKIDSAFLNPLSNRWCWSGTNGGFVTTIVNLPTSASGQTIQLRWRAGSDNGAAGLGWWIDTVLINGYACCANTAPVLTGQPNRTIAELTTLTVTNAATDAESPPGTLTYELLSPPAGANINTNGVITWTPSESQGPGTNFITTVVRDSSAPPLSATNSFTVTVTEVNSAPVLPTISNLTINVFANLVITNTATDSDLPANILTYSFLSSPSGAALSADGIITWTPTEAQAPSTNLFTTVVTDNGIPILRATNSFLVFVTDAPVILSLDLSNDVATVAWQTRIGNSYRLEYKDSLDDLQWIPASPTILATNLTLSATNDINGALQRFYRIVLQP
jgi:hypothetical protein